MKPHNLSNSERNKFEQLSISSFIFPLENPSFTLMKLLFSLDRISIITYDNLFKRFDPDFDVSLTTLFALIKSDRHPSYKWPANRLKNRTNVKTRGFSFSNLFRSTKSFNPKLWSLPIQCYSHKNRVQRKLRNKNRKIILKSQEHSVSLFLDFLEHFDPIRLRGILEPDRYVREHINGNQFTKL